jgi:D-alanyl-lipoteichoic acid acyltransferase DltB (MBOAT superfamily)
MSIQTRTDADMLFNSVDYALLLSFSVLFYYLAPSGRLQQIILLVASIAFYASWIPIYILLILGLVSLNFVLALNAVKGRWFVIIAIIANLGTLAYFKYMMCP